MRLVRRAAGADVSAIALGSTSFGFPDATHDAESLGTLRTAFDAGVNVVDTALCYTSSDEVSHAERVVAEAVRSAPHEVHVATKGGHWRAGAEFPVDGRADTLRRHCDVSLQTLGVDAIWLYYLHWPDPAVPIEESVSALAELQRDGKIQHIGLSNVDADLLARARSVASVAAVQNSFSLVTGGDREVLDICNADGVAFFAYSPLGGGAAAKSLGTLVPAAARVAAARGVSPQQVALAWLLAQGPEVVAIVGAAMPNTVQDSVAAADLTLDQHELEILTRHVGEGS